MEANVEIRPRPTAVRLHYLDWLRVIAIFGVFLYHSLHVFDMNPWHIKNSDQSLELTIILILFGMWGLPFFFMVSGSGSWFALRRRSARAYTLERFQRLAVPFVFGAVSSRLSGLPAMVQSLAFLSGTSLGASSLLAASATLP